MDTTVLVLSVDALWLLQSRVRHEHAAMDTWHYPLASASLNDAIAEALLFCEETQAKEAAIVVTWGDLLLIDAVVDASAKDAEGKPLGKPLLLKTFKARQCLRRGYPDPDVPAEPPAPSRAEVVKQLKEHDDA